MARCRDCRHEMSRADSCTVDLVHVDGRPLAMVAYGAEARRGGSTRPVLPCNDCGVEPGGLHHVGCSGQECPRCGDLFRSCGCGFDEYPGDRHLMAQ